MAALANPDRSDADFARIWEAGIVLEGKPRLDTLEALGSYLFMQEIPALGVVQQMIRRGYPLNTLYGGNEDGHFTRSLLLDAVVDGSIELVSLLVANGADPDLCVLNLIGGGELDNLSPYLALVDGDGIPDREEKLAILQACRVRRLAGELLDTTLPPTAP